MEASPTNWSQWALVACVLLVILAGWSAISANGSYKPQFLEGFIGGNSSGGENFFSKYFMRRYDVVPGQGAEDYGFLRDPRYSEAYADVQRTGMKNDFCRVVKRPGLSKEEDDKGLMVACALGGTEGLDPYVYKSRTVGQGFRLSRDDYYADANGDGRDDYCRILKMGPDKWEAQCSLGTETGFADLMVADAKPPAEIKDLLWFYEGIVLWYRFFDDMVDYAENTRLSLLGDIRMDEDPRKGKTGGLELNRIPAGSPVGGQEQFLRLGETDKLEFGTAVKLRNLRAISFWVNWDGFTNNAKIFDFGNGAGQDNIFLGIDGKGDVDPKQMEFNAARPTDSDRVCRREPTKEVSPQRFLRITDGNVDDWECDGPGPVDEPLEEKDFDVPQDGEETATLLFEIWDERQRKMRIKVPKVFRLRKWTHIALTTTDNESFRPTWELYVDGLFRHREEDGHMAQTNFTRNNYIGRSNWEEPDSQFANKDERFSGSIFDFRIYKTPMSVPKIERTIQWARPKLRLAGEA